MGEFSLLNASATFQELQKSKIRVKNFISELLHSLIDKGNL